MHEHELSDRMNIAVADAPPLSFDPDRTVDNAVKRQRNRRATAGSAAAVVAVAAGAVFAVGNTGPWEASVAAQAIAPADCRGDHDNVGKDEEAVAAKKVTNELRNVVRDRVPQVNLKVDEPRPETTQPEWDTAGNIASRGYGKVIDPRPNDPDGAYTEPTVGVQVSHSSDKLDTAHDWVACGAGGRKATLVREHRLKDGSVVRQYRVVFGELHQTTVMNFRTDGTIVEATTEVPTQSDSWRSQAPDRKQLLSIATDPRLHW